MRDHLMQRRPAGAAVAPSDDVCRYQASDMPRPTYDLDRKHESASLFMILVLTGAVVATGAATVLIQRIGTWLSP